MLVRTFYLLTPLTPTVSRSGFQFSGVSFVLLRPNGKTDHRNYWKG